VKLTAVVTKMEIPPRTLISRLANTLEAMYEAREQGDVEQETRLQARMMPLLVQALTSKDDDLLELSVYCVSLLEEEAYVRVQKEAQSKAADDPQIIESLRKVAELSRGV
jgi:hypothetical protein